MRGVSFNGRDDRFLRDGGDVGLRFLATPVPVTSRKTRLLVCRTAYGNPCINEIEAYGE